MLFLAPEECTSRQRFGEKRQAKEDEAANWRAQKKQQLESRFLQDDTQLSNMVGLSNFRIEEQDVRNTFFQQRGGFVIYR